MPDTDQVVWRILYADKDTEDFTADQMIDYCIMKVDGSTSTPAPAETAPPAAPASSAAAAGAASGEEPGESSEPGRLMACALVGQRWGCR